MEAQTSPMVVHKTLLQRDGFVKRHLGKIGQTVEIQVRGSTCWMIASRNNPAHAYKMTSLVARPFPTSGAASRQDIEFPRLPLSCSLTPNHTSNLKFDL
jgi:hypothetical protein